MDNHRSFIYCLSVLYRHLWLPLSKDRALAHSLKFWQGSKILKKYQFSRWPLTFQHLPTNLKLTPFFNLSLMYVCTKFCFGDSFPSWWGSVQQFTIEIHRVYLRPLGVNKLFIDQILCISMVKLLTLPHHEGKESPKWNLVQMWIRLELTNGVSFKLVSKCWKGQRSPWKSGFLKYFASSPNFGALSKLKWMSKSSILA